MKLKLEKRFNSEGQEQRINNFDKIIKIGNKFLQVRLIETKKWRERFDEGGDFTAPMPRARFIHPEENPYYLVRRSDVIKMKGGKNGQI